MHLSFVKAKNCDKCQKVDIRYRTMYDICVKHYQNVIFSDASGKPGNGLDKHL